MIIPKESELTDAQLQEVRDIVAAHNCRIDVIQGANRCIYAILGDERHETMINRIEGLDYIDRVDTIDAPYKLMHRDSQLADHSLTIAGKQPRKEPLFIAGPCTVDPKEPNHTIETAHAIKDAGAHVLRGGIWKPRTMPYSYQGDVKALETLLEARSQTGLPINTEVMNFRQLQTLVDAGVDMVQIGARNSLNYSLLREVGEYTADKGTVVLLKRGRSMAPVDEFIAAAEYVAAAGNPRLLLCPRGTMPPMDGYRNHPDESIIPLLKEKTWAATVADPSHAVGRARYVPYAAMAAMAYGADGLCIESHIQPTSGIGDDPKQAIEPHELKRVLEDALVVYQRTRAYLNDLMSV